jgi:ribose/xylose/arabinose/galactoside ABC-type transport system permease subunit
MSGVRKQVLQILPGLLFLVLISLISGILMPRFVRLLPSSLLLAIPTAFLGFAESLVMIAGEVDLSLTGSLVLINAISVSAYTDYHINEFLFVVIPLVTGLIIGAIHGLLVAFGRLNSFLVTAGTSFAWSGLALVILRQPRGKVPLWFNEVFSIGKVLGVPLVVLFIVIAALFWLLFSVSPLALKSYAVGSSPKATFSFGIDVNRIKFYAFVLNGVLVGIAGLIMTGIIGSGDPRLGGFSTVLAVLAALIGGATFAGGTGNGLGAFLAAIALQFTRNLIAWVGVAHYHLDLFYGAALLVLIAGIAYLRRSREI